MLFFASSILLAAVASARPSRILYRDAPVEVGGFKVLAANRIIPVVVGGPQDTFVPNMVKASVGDIIQFQFSNGNHTVTQSAKDAPCTPLTGGIHSGHIPFQDGQTTVGTFNMPVTSTDALFLYCATGPHCQEGQVMVVNPTDDQQIVDYAKASQSTKSSVDGTTVTGGTVASIPLEAAAFVPAPVQEGSPGGAPPAAAAPAAPAATSAATSAAASVPGTTTTTITVPAATASPAPAA
ncbi:uncharacterized protein F4812DRAFT_463125 [Daldinia caldariorum]|uniref:uncharacterized protein n=1 Tax=Daldinia caldariorum TaxID=326644 RepID=UPI0020085ED5|nr:uncharacterized protein F4812DRAFT_463125 [Daldinia caldariorum]KAI1464064.1 hypothetical protein F4812DRAFT_463125 [Daldinia caldariorum]